MILADEGEDRKSRRFLGEKKTYWVHWNYFEALRCTNGNISFFGKLL